MSRSKLREGWRQMNQNGKVWYEPLANDVLTSGPYNVRLHWRVERPADNRKGWCARRNEYATPDRYTKTLTEAMLYVEEYIEQWRKRNNVQPPEEPDLPSQEAAPRSYVDSLDFECDCGRRHLVQIVQTETRVQDSEGSVRKAKGTVVHTLVLS